jgi:integrase
MTRTAGRQAGAASTNAATMGGKVRQRTDGDTRYLEWHGRAGGQWRVVVYVPRHLKKVIGKAAFRRGLKTQELRVAQARRWAVVNEFRAIIEAAEAKASGRPVDPVFAEAVVDKEIHDILITVANVTGEPSDAEMLAEFMENILPNRVRRIANEHGPQKAREYEAIARGQRTPLALHLDRWIKETPHFRRRTHDVYRRAVKRLGDFATEAGWQCSVETFDRRAAGYFASHLSDSGVHPATANKLLSSLSAYWKWMLRKGLAEGENPWRFQSIPEAKGHLEGGKSKKREFTDDELCRLLYPTQPCDPLLREFMLIAALSGMRINEIANIKVQDVDLNDRTVLIPTATTKAGVRRVPIHSAVLDIFTRRVSGQSSPTWLFPELPEQSKSRESERYMPVSKRFDRYRQSVGVHERPEGQRQSNVEFHSFRRWFITKVQRTNMPRDVIKAIVGHKDGSVTFDIYAGGPSLKRFRDVVEAVKLPKLQVRK